RYAAARDRPRADAALAARLRWAQLDHRHDQRARRPRVSPRDPDERDLQARSRARESARDRLPRAPARSPRLERGQPQRWSADAQRRQVDLDDAADGSGDVGSAARRGSADARCRVRSQDPSRCTGGRPRPAARRARRRRGGRVGEVDPVPAVEDARDGAVARPARGRCSRSAGRTRDVPATRGAAAGVARGAGRRTEVIYWSGPTQLAMSKKMNASAFSCGVIGARLPIASTAQPPGYATVGSDVEPDDTCMSLNTTLPQRSSGIAVTGVVNCMSCTLENPPVPWTAGSIQTIRSDAAVTFVNIV